MKSIKRGWTASLIASYLLSGCMAAPLVAVVGTTVGGEAATEQILPAQFLTGKEIKQITGNSLTIKKQTKSLSGVEKWICADEVNDPDMKRTGYIFLCVDEQQYKYVGPQSNTKFSCKEGKGGLVTMMLNKHSGQTIFCTR